MYRELWHEPHIGSYRAMLLLGFFFGYLLARWRAKTCKLEQRHIDNLALLLLVLGPAGARLFSRLFYYPTPLTFWQALKVWEDGGLVFYGGVIFGIITLLIYTRIMRVPLFKLLDVFAPSLALGLAFGRVGCFLAGCCWGDICASPAELQKLGNPSLQNQMQTFPVVSHLDFPLAVRFPAETGAFEQHQALGLISADALRSLPVHPTQLYEAALALLLCWLLHAAFKGKRADGEIVWMMGINYAFMRFWMEFLRADSQPIYLNGMTLSQVISLMIALFCLLFFVGRRYWLPKNMNRSILPVPLETVS